MKTEQAILSKIQELENENQLLKAKKSSIVNQNEINVEDMNKLMSKEDKVLSNQVHIDVLKWVLE